VDAAIRGVRLFALALAALALAIVLALAAGHPLSASASSARVDAAKLKKCKPGLNSKKCRCPKGTTRVKSGKKYRCKKKPAPNNNGGGQQQTGGDNTGTGNTGTGGPGTNEPPLQAPPSTVTPVRDDAAFAAALSGTMLRRYEEGTYGYGRYAYNYLPGGQFLFCSYYYAGSTVEANRAGTWEVVQGYTVPGYPGYTAGQVRIVGSDFNVLMAVEMLDNRSNVATGNASNVFTQGSFTRFIGGATTNCSSIT
jgi:hypothetical protein